MGLTTAVVFLTLLQAAPSFEAVTPCAREVQCFHLPSLSGPLQCALVTQLAECRRRHPKAVSITLNHSRTSGMGLAYHPRDAVGAE